MRKVSVAAWALLIVEVGLVLVSTFGIISVTYETRSQFAELEQARSQQQLLQEQWGRLLLEESAFSSPSRVERVAREQLKMVLPSMENTQELDLSK